MSLVMAASKLALGSVGIGGIADILKKFLEMLQTELFHGPEESEALMQGVVGDVGLKDAKFRRTSLSEADAIENGGGSASLQSKAASHRINAMLCGSDYADTVASASFQERLKNFTVSDETRKEVEKYVDKFKEDMRSRYLADGMTPAEASETSERAAREYLNAALKGATEVELFREMESEKQHEKLQTIVASTPAVTAQRSKSAAM